MKDILGKKRLAILSVVLFAICIIIKVFLIGFPVSIENLSVSFQKEPNSNELLVEGLAFNYKITYVQTKDITIHGQQSVLIIPHGTKSFLGHDSKFQKRINIADTSYVVINEYKNLLWSSEMTLPLLRYYQDNEIAKEKQITSSQDAITLFEILSANNLSITNHQDMKDTTDYLLITVDGDTYKLFEKSDFYYCSILNNTYLLDKDNYELFFQLLYE